MDQHVEDLVGLLDHLGIATAHLAGLSHGGLVAAAMAQTHPDRIGRLVICNTRPWGSATTTSVIRRWQNLLRTDGLRALATALVQEGTGPRFRARHGAMLDQLIDAVVARNSAVGLERQLVAMTDDPPLAQILQAVNAPTLIIAATEDPIAPAAESKLLADTIGAEFALIKNVGHSLPAEDPETFSTRIETFLAPQAGDTDAPGQPR